MKHILEGGGQVISHKNRCVIHPTGSLIATFFNTVEPFSKKCDIYCNKRYWCINYAEPYKGLQ